MVGACGEQGGEVIAGRQKWWEGISFVSYWRGLRRGTANISQLTSVKNAD
jgi:hypothetical protein